MRPRVIALSCLLVSCGGGPGHVARTPATAPRTPPPQPTEATPPSASTADPCAAREIDLDEAENHCASAAQPTPAPSPDSLGLSMADAEARSGDHTELVVDMRNTTDGAMALVFRPGCSFEVLVYDQDGKVANQEYGGIIGGVCGAGSAIAVTLPAGGILRKRIDWEVRKERLECRDDDVCTIVPGSPIAPARYRIEVSTPFSDPVDGNPQHRRARRATATLVVTD